MVASVRLGVGSILLAGSGLARLVDAAIVADGNTWRSPPGPTPGGAGNLSSRVARATQEAAGKAARAGRVAAGVAPAVVRHPVELRLRAWRTRALDEQERSRAAAAAGLEVAAKFMTDWIVERLDVNRIVERLRLDEIIASLELTDVIVSSSGGVTGHVLDNARSRAVGADTLVDRAMAHLRHGRGVARREPDRAAVIPPAPA